MAGTQVPQVEWWSAFPDPKAKCPEISADAVMKMFDDMDIEPRLREFLLIDVRRTDWEVSLQENRLKLVVLKTRFILTFAGRDY